MHFSFEHHCHHCHHAIRDQSALLPLTQVDMTGESGWAGSVPTPFGSVGSGAAPVLYHDSWTHGATWAGMEVFPPPCPARLLTLGPSEDSTAVRSAMSALSLVN